MPAPSTGSRRAATWLIAGVFAGIAIALVGLLWPKLIRPQHVWTPEKAAEYQAASSALQHATESGPGDQPSPAGIAPRGVDPEARRRFEAISAELEAARHVRDGWGRLMVSGGIALTALCGMGYLALRGQ